MNDFSKRKDIRTEIHKNGLFNHLKKSYNSELVKVIKMYFNVCHKMTKVWNHITFLTYCQSQKVLPNFTNFKLTNHRLNKFSNKKSFRKEILGLEIKSHKRNFRALEIRKKELFDKINFKIYPIDWGHITNKLENSLSKYDLIVKNKHTKNSSIWPTPIVSMP